MRIEIDLRTTRAQPVARPYALYALGVLVLALWIVVGAPLGALVAALIGAALVRRSLRRGA